MDKVEVKVNGKLILSGEHSVVYGEPALIAGVKLGVEVELDKVAGSKVVLESEQSRDKWVGGCSELDEYLFEAEVARKKYLMGNESALKKYWSDWWGVMKLALGSAGCGGMRVKVKSQIPVGSGFGSSAAIAVGIVKAVAKAKGEELTGDEVFVRAMRVEEIVHGRASGVDVRAVIEGGVLRFVKKEKGFDYGKVEVEGELSEVMVVMSGVPKETTGQMVGLVAEKLKYDKVKTSRLIKKIGKLTAKFEDKVRTGVWDDELVKENERLLDELGVVGERARAMIREIEKEGAVAKVCGAGGVKAGSGVLLVVGEDMERLERLVEKSGWKMYRLKLGVNE